MTESVNRPTLACVVITKNEERNITDCLASVRWADDMIVIDAESNDKTVELAARLRGQGHRASLARFRSAEKFRDGTGVVRLDSDPRCRRTSD